VLNASSAACTSAVYMHSLTSALLFLVAGWLSDMCQTRLVSEIPFWSVTFVRLLMLVLLLSNGGFPLLGLFWSEAFLLAGVLDTRSMVLFTLLAACSVLALLSGLLILTSQSREGLSRTGLTANTAVVWVCILFVLWLLLQVVDVLGLWSMGTL